MPAPSVPGGGPRSPRVAHVAAIMTCGGRFCYNSRTTNTGVASMRNRSMLLASLLGLGFALPVAADVLLIERAEQAQRAGLPANGLTMAQVESRFGAPVEKLAPVAGYKPDHPPITRWRYAGYTVYFEHSRVISTVMDTAAAGQSR